MFSMNADIKGLQNRVMHNCDVTNAETEYVTEKAENESLQGMKLLASIRQHSKHKKDNITEIHMIEGRL